MSTEVTPFSEQLSYMAKGSVNDEATEKLAELVKAVRTTGKKGSITLKIDVSMLDKASEDAMRLVGSVTAKLPELENPTTVMFSTHDGDLLRDDPEQMALNLRQVGRAEPESVRRVEASQPQAKVLNAGE
ncbi:MAG: hypothetical protein LAT65_05710 [Saccharospirillum sp.]|nr:hypothetical protein [Saccharospirillum sp.]